MDFKKLPESELKVMKFIWNLEKNEVASRDVVEAMKHKYEWNKNTTLTILSKLAKKNYLYAQKTSKCTFYTIAVREKDYLKAETKKFFKFWHNNSFKSFLTALNDDEEISKDKLDTLEALIKEWEES
ncbi:TPA: BlaI/MecI/CopY family transcriptional regulator [Clostridioides difficile]|nr:BlaI/MecI/CopY family transcriptional regulator [Clostridioides difficile]MDO0374378.1 BlaI/MecI/CopY family transcriptional regulator [Clostridioides difficile]MDV5877669.1 BlaI/MecI/CopY family transcriptional regulator [Clostridioides difficile]HBG0910534.1 BlaI/MecI/CopY family transcriptional regulator [Clostridioides difficile]HBG2117115.1 BlaI/MecI/CopY family transcriptional regulator [Clostridioides difficile]